MSIALFLEITITLSNIFINITLMYDDMIKFGLQGAENTHY